MKKLFVVCMLITGLGVAPVVLSHLDSTAFHLSYRQSLYALLGANFGPMSSMIKGEMPWNDEKFQGFADDLARASKLNFTRGFPPGTGSGRTRPKPGLWENMRDFEDKLANLREESEKMALVAASRNKRAILQQFQKTGGACKACHDEYKSKDYLN